MYFGSPEPRYLVFVHERCQTTIVEDAWYRAQELAVHGWIYRVQDGLLWDLKICITKSDELTAAYQSAFPGTW